MKYAFHNKPSNYNSLGVLGYLIVINKQVHSYQIDALENYLSGIKTSIDDSLLADIIDGKSSAISLECSLESLSNETDETRYDICYMLLLLSQLDNVIDEKEETLISKVFQKIGLSDETRRRLADIACEDASSYRKNKNSLFENEFMNNSVAIKKNKHSKRVVNDNDYIDVIKRCEKIAKEDFSVVKPSYDAIIAQNRECLDTIERIGSTIPNDNELSECVGKIVKIFTEAVREKVIDQTQIAKELLEQKERTLPDFTITFLGRTKAGKSTLHAILTKTGYDKIGAGRQRTTRYNRVYQWNLIRLIDTPGIGSAEAEGRTDDEIAESVLGESDVICIVVADDSILKDILDLMDKASLFNKPIIILLNHKENIRNEVRYRRFIANPSKWFADTGEANLDGHIDRIKKYAKDKGYSDLVKPYKVFLLAARMASEVDSKYEREILWKNSGIESFINDLRESIVCAGTIKRSQTIIDESIQKIEQISSDLNCAIQPINNHILFLEKSKEKTIKTLKQERNVTVKRIKDVVLEKGMEVAEEKSKEFARELYENKKISDMNNVADKWDDFINKTGIKEELLHGVDYELNNYINKSDNVIKELFDDISYNIVNEFHIDGVAIPINIDFKQIFRICNLILAGEAIALGVLTIFFPFLAAVEAIVFVKWILVDAITALAKNRYEKKEIYIRRVHKTIRRKIISASKKQAKEVSKMAQSEIDKQIDRIDSVFEERIEELRTLSQQVFVMDNAYKAQKTWLNKVYAWRIIQFLKNKNDKFSVDVVNDTIDGVYRTNNTIYIGTSKKNRIKADCLKDVLADKIDFV